MIVSRRSFQWVVKWKSSVLSMLGKKWNIEQKNYLPDIKTPDSLNRFRECR